MGATRGIPTDGDSPNGRRVLTIEGWMGAAIEGSKVGSTVVPCVGLKVVTWVGS